MVFLTKLKPEPMGAHNLSTAYGVNSLVMSGDGAAAYISVKDVPAGTPLTDTDYWRPHTDLTAVVQSAEAAAQKANAARDEMLEIARNLTDAVEKSGNPVQAELVGGLPFDRVATVLSPKQAGSGVPSPTNIRAISGWTGAKIVKTGKNLWNGKISYEESGTPDLCGYTDPITIAVKFVSGTSQFNYRVIYTDGTEMSFLFAPTGFENGVWRSVNISPEKPLRSIHFTSIDAATTRTVDKIMVMFGTHSVTDEIYEPPQTVEEFSASFGQTVYGGTLDWMTGVLTVDTGYKAFDGTEGFIENDKYYLMYPDNIPNDGDQPVVSSHFKKLKNLAEGEFDGVQGISLSWGLRFYLRATYSTLDEFKAYIAAQYAAGTPVQIAYKLGTPTTIQLTPREIRQLQGTNTLYGDGSISIAGRANPALALDARIAALESAATNV